jgi:RNA polymerase sigma factor (sigma-70 family)
VDHADSFTTFYTAAHGHVLTAVSATLRDPHLAAEAVDEAFVRAAERWRSVQEVRNKEGWVYRVAINWATSWRRKLALRPTRSAAHLDRAHRDEVPDLDLADALAVLPLDQRQTLVLRYAFGCSVRDTAAQLGVTEGTVKSRVSRARERLLADGSWQDDDHDDPHHDHRHDHRHHDRSHGPHHDPHHDHRHDHRHDDGADELASEHDDSEVTHGRP